MVSTYTHFLNPDIGCSNCTIRKQCDDISWRRNFFKLEEMLGLGARGAIVCLRLYSAYKPKELRIK